MGLVVLGSAGISLYRFVHRTFGIPGDLILGALAVGIAYRVISDIRNRRFSGVSKILLAIWGLAVMLVLVAEHL